MSSQYFGFDEDETLDVVDANKTLAAGQNTVNKQSSPVKVPISEIQALLSRDVTANDSTVNTSLNESSFYGDEDTSICQSQLDSTMEESFAVDQSMLMGNFTLNGKTRKNCSGERRKRKKLDSIENKENENITTPKRIYKKPVSRTVSATKNKENQKPKKAKHSKKEIRDENYEKLAEQIQKQFNEIENFQLLVE